MRDRLEELRGEGLRKVEEAQSEADLRAVEVGLLGRKGAITDALKALGGLPHEERPAMGQLANQVKAAIQSALDVKREQMGAAALEAELSGVGFDATLPGPATPSGGQHPISAITRELEDLFSSMGFQIADGPEVELEANNFDALNIPSDHPARESHDTIWVTPEAERRGDGTGVVLRTHTSPVQVRALRKYGAPLRVIAPGRVFRRETLDATHEHTFHQMEGLVVDKGVGVGHMLHAMNTLIEGVMGRKLETRLRPGFFPFVEPGFELDARCPFCKSGCSVCKGTRWIELMPGGLVHPHVLESAGLDPNEYSGFAFGLGLSRIVMLRYGIDDIRWFMSGALPFLQQFPA